MSEATPPYEVDEPDEADELDEMLIDRDLPDPTIERPTFGSKEWRLRQELWMQATDRNRNRMNEIHGRAREALSPAAYRYFFAQYLRRITTAMAPEEDDPTMWPAAKREAIAFLDAEERVLVEANRKRVAEREEARAKRRARTERNKRRRAVEEAVGEVVGASLPLARPVVPVGARVAAGASAGEHHIPTVRVKDVVYHRMAVYWMRWLVGEAAVPPGSHQAQVWKFRVQPVVLGRRGNERPAMVVDPESLAKDRIVDGLGLHIENCAGGCGVDDVVWARVLEVMARPFPGVPEWQVRNKPFYCRDCDRNFGVSGIKRHKADSGHENIVRRVR